MNTASVVLACIGVGCAGLLFGSGSVDVYKAVNPPPVKERKLVVKELSYDPKTNLITQQVYAVGPERMNGDWSAKITRGEVILCSGGATAPYTSEASGGPKRFTPKDWTFGRETSCTADLKLQPGDVAFATWEWRDGRDLRKGTWAELTVPEG